MSRNRCERCSTPTDQHLRRRIRSHRSARNSTREKPASRQPRDAIPVLGLHAVAQFGAIRRIGGICLKSWSRVEATPQCNGSAIDLQSGHEMFLIFSPGDIVSRVLPSGQSATARLQFPISVYGRLKPGRPK